MRFGQEIPADLVPPELHDIEWQLWSAFWELSTERQVGFSPGPIPGSAIRQYAATEQGADRSSFAAIIRAMDDVYLSHKSGESKTFSRDMMKR